MPIRSPWQARGPVLGLALTAALLLGGCAGTRIVEGDVQSYSRLPALPSPATYRIERLPSQQDPSFDPIVALAQQALGRAGLQPASAGQGQAALIAQIGVQAGQVPRRDLYAPHPWSLGWYGPGWGTRGLWRMGEPTPLHRRAVSVVLRDARTQDVVYETSAVHEDVWVIDPDVYGVLFDAALAGFPQPPTGPRQVRLPLPSTSR